MGEGSAAPWVEDLREVSGGSDADGPVESARQVGGNDGRDPARRAQAAYLRELHRREVACPGLRGAGRLVGRRDALVSGNEDRRARPDGGQLLESPSRLLGKL